MKQRKPQKTAAKTPDYSPSGLQRIAPVLQVAVPNPFRQGTASQPSGTGVVYDTAEFDSPSPPGRFGPLSASQRATWKQAKRGPGRPRVGKGAGKIRISLERGLLSRADAFTKQHKLSRSQLIAKGLELAMQQHGR